MLTKHGAFVQMRTTSMHQIKQNINTMQTNIQDVAFWLKKQNMIEATKHGFKKQNML